MTNDLPEVLAQITAPHFCAGLVLTGAKVSMAAPIVGYVRGWTAARVKAYCDRKGWKVARVPSAAAAPKIGKDVTP